MGIQLFHADGFEGYPDTACAGNLFETCKFRSPYNFLTRFTKAKEYSVCPIVGNYICDLVKHRA